MTRARTAILALAIAVAAAMPAGAEASATWIVHGAGFGHGVGMGAYGAYGYGLHGYGYRQILHHYFRDIQITTLTKVPKVRVLLEVNPGDVRFTHATEACGRTLDASSFYLAHRDGSSVQLRSSSGKPLAGCGGRLHAESAGSVWISGLGAYRGALETVPTEGAARALNVVNDVNVDSYVRGSVPAEVPPEWPMATLKAFTVASRSIALSTDVGGNDFAIYSDTRTQNYGGIADEAARTDLAAQSTRSQVVTYNGEIAQTTYFSSSGGMTESRFLGGPQVPYLESVQDPYDYYSPLHRWTVSFSEAEMDARLGPYLDGALLAIRVTQRGQSPRINYAKLIGTGGTTTIRGDTLAEALGLYERWAFFKKVPSPSPSPKRSSPHSRGYPSSSGLPISGTRSAGRRRSSCCEPRIPET